MWSGNDLMWSWTGSGRWLGFVSLVVGQLKYWRTANVEIFRVRPSESTKESQKGRKEENGQKDRGHVLKNKVTRRS